MDFQRPVHARKSTTPPPMERKTAREFDQELLDLYDAYVHGGTFVVAHPRFFQENARVNRPGRSEARHDSQLVSSS